ncbi:MAG TPA: haloacid dehalogenase type II [Thermoanaerobaculia bacterium]|nr:haloacid dehalogenase type II [Thermoanaerobaculia bacterium]
MSIDRREFLLAAGSVVVAGGFPLPASATPSRFKAVAFDAFPIFDPRPIAELTESLFPEKGRAIVDAWRTRQFEYQWLRALSGKYADFLQTTEESLRFAAKQLQVAMPPETQQKLMAAYADLKVWPDAPRAIHTLRDAGLRLVFLSNMTRAMLERGLTSSNLDKTFDGILSTDAIRSYKPDPKAYRMAVDALRLKREEILFVAFAGWDVAGAKWFGYPTFWVNRAGSPLEELGAVPDGSGRDLNALVEFVLPGSTALSSPSRA